MQTGYSLRGKQIDIPTYWRSEVMPQRKNIKAEIWEIFKKTSKAETLQQNITFVLKIVNTIQLYCILTI